MATDTTPKRDDWSLMLIGMFLLTLVGGLLCLQMGRELVANIFYVEGRCVVLDKRVAEHTSRRGGNSTYRPEFLIRYEVVGQKYEVWAYDASDSSSALRWPKERVLEEFTVGEEYPCWYDPDNPSKVVVVRGFGWMTYVLLLVSLTLILLIAKGVFRRLHGAAAEGANESAGA